MKSMAILVLLMCSSFSSFATSPTIVAKMQVASEIQNENGSLQILSDGTVQFVGFYFKKVTVLAVLSEFALKKVLLAVHEIQKNILPVGVKLSKDPCVQKFQYFQWKIRKEEKFIVFKKSYCGGTIFTSSIRAAIFLERLMKGQYSLIADY